MQREITTEQDIRLLVNSFYDKVNGDPSIGFIFNDIAKVDWEKHMPVMYSFWESVLFGAGRYKGNPMPVHMHLNQKIKLERKHFERWLQLFHATVDELFTGEKAELAKQRATSIATVMQIKIIQGGIGLR